MRRSFIFLNIKYLSPTEMLDTPKDSSLLVVLAELEAELFRFQAPLIFPASGTTSLPNLK